MGIHNSLEFLHSLTLRLYRDIAEMSGIPDHVSKRDEDEITHRYRKEGASFFTVTLPSIGKAVDTALLGLEPLEVTALKKQDNSKLPIFMGRLFATVFGSDGYPLHSVGAAPYLKWLRSFLYFSYKLELPYDKKTERSVLESFIKTEVEMSNQHYDFGSMPLVSDARDFITSVCASCPRISLGRPKHGPGAVATGQVGPEKFQLDTAYDSMNWHFGVTDWFRLSNAHAADRPFNCRLESPTAKVVMVPKDSRGPRLISCEPLEVQWVQQGLARVIVRHLETHPLTRGHVNFTCQDINRRLALVSSSPAKTGLSSVFGYSKRYLDDDGLPKEKALSVRFSTDDFVTLDMKDASDRVSLALVKYLFGISPWLGYLLASRSARTRLPDGRELRLHKFAPMGSALCFPIEAFVFYALAVAAIRERHVSWRESASRVFVYGDDIICEREDYPLVMRLFQSVGLVFNERKCCTSGFFRESCGCDAYLGIDVTPIRYRKVWSHQGLDDATQLASHVDLTNRLMGAGYWRAGIYVRSQVEALYGPLPDYNHAIDDTLVDSQSTAVPSNRVIGFSYSHVAPHLVPNRRQRIRCSSPKGKNDFQRREVFGWMVKAVRHFGSPNHWDAYFHSLAAGSTGAKVGVHALPRCTRLVHGWGEYT